MPITQGLHEYTSPVVSLIFEGYTQHTDINTALKLASEGSDQRIWSFSTVDMSEESFESGEFVEWQTFLQQKKAALLMLSEAGYKGRIRIQIKVPANSGGAFAEHFLDTVAIAPSFINLLSQLSLALEVQHEKDVVYAAINDAANPYTLVIPEPSAWFYRDDESNFFNWLENISAVSSVKGSGTSLILYLNRRILDDVSLRSLIALMARYDLDMSCLRAQLDESNSHWLQNPNYYFHEKIFGDGSKSEGQKADKKK